MQVVSLHIITPDGEAYVAHDPISITCPTSEGEINILPGHVPLVAEVIAGAVVVLRATGAPLSLVVDKGFLKAANGEVLVLVEAAIEVAAIDLSALEKAEKEAQDILQAVREAKITIDPEEVEKLEATLRFSLVQRLAKGKD